MSDTTILPGSGAADAGPPGPAPRSGWVLFALILVAAVANLNLAVANVALPDIGKAFDSSPDDAQPDRGRVSRSASRRRSSTSARSATGTAASCCSLLGIGSVGSRLPARRARALGRGAVRSPALLGGLAAGMAYPTTLALITALWSGPAAPSPSRCGPRSAAPISALGPLLAGALLEHVLVGLGLPDHAAARRRRAGPGDRPGPRHVNETTDPVDNLGGILSVVLVAALVLAINFAAVPGTATLALGLGAVALVGRRRLRSPAAPRRQPALRPAHRRPPDLLGRRLRRDHRVRLPDGRDVRRPAVPAERARLLDAGRRRRDSARRGRRWSSWRPRSAKLIEARGARFTLLVGYVFCLLGLFADAAAVGRGQPVLAGRPGATPSSGSASGSPARPRRTRSPARSRCQGRHGLGHRRPPARPRRRDHAVDPRRPAHRRVRVRLRRGDRGIAARDKISGTVQTDLQKSFASAADVASSIRSTPNRSSPRRSRRSWPATLAYLRDRHLLAGAAMVFFCFPRREREQELLAGYAAEDAGAGVAASARSVATAAKHARTRRG